MDTKRQGLLAVAIVAVVGLIVGLVVVLNSDDSGDRRGAPPAGTDDSTLLDDAAADRVVAAVQGYYAAVRAGDASKALSYGPRPLDTTLLTDEVLGRQADIAPITSVRVDHDILVLHGKHALVDVVVTIDGHAHDESIDFDRTGGTWRMRDVAAEVGLTGTGSPPLDVYGTKIRPGENVYVFPGAVLARSATPYLALYSGQTGIAAVPGSSNAFQDLTWRMTPTAIASTQAAVRAALRACATSDRLYPDDVNCPNSLPGRSADEGSVHWSAPTDYRGLRVGASDDGPTLTSIPVSGTVTFTVTYTHDGKRERGRVPVDLDGGSVDLTDSPPSFQR